MSSTFSVPSTENDSEDGCYNDLPFDFMMQENDLNQDYAANKVHIDGNDGVGPKPSTGSRQRRDAELASSSFQVNCHERDCEAGLDQRSNSEDPFRDRLSVANQNTWNEPSFPPPVPCVSSQQPLSSSPPRFATTASCADTRKSIFLPHKSSLKRIVPPPNNSEPSVSHNKHDPSVWPVYSITVNLEPTSPIHSTSIPHTQTTIHEATSSYSLPAQHQYQILFSRAQYEQCSRLFTLLDIECTSSLGPECIKDFVSRHCPVIRRRDDALLQIPASNVNACEGGSGERTERSPTLDEIWNVVLQSDPRYSTQQQHQHGQQNSTIFTPRLGIEGWMVFTRLLSLVSHYESQRRFASRHLQQMMRHKHNSGSSPRVNPNEVVVVVDNPPAGPPVAVSVRGLMEVERKVGKEDGSCKLVEGWPFGSLPFIELDLDHVSIGKFQNSVMRRGGALKTRRIVIQPFSNSLEGDFILRYGISDSPSSHEANTPIVVRRSYADFCWLNQILNKQKRPGHGHLCGRIIPPFPSEHGSSISSRSGNRQYRTHRPKDVSERAVAVAKSGVGMITSVAKSLWGNYIAPTAASGTSTSSPTKKKTESEAKPSSSIGAYYPWSGVPHREEDIPSDVAKKMGRYLNYLLENDALSSSFPLNAVLTASQPGLECAKLILQDHSKQKKRRRTNQALSSADGGTSSAYAILSALLAKNASSLSDGDDAPWVRTAARAAMSLQFHGILETAGHESTSAKIQHASLPKFGVSSSNWDDDESDNSRGAQRLNHQESGPVEGDFEAGVISIESELSSVEGIGGYDLLPSPGPSEEHHVLNATNVRSFSGKDIHSSSRSRYVYGTSNARQESPTTIYESYSADAVTLGSVKVDSDIDKLKGIIKSVDRILRRLHHTSMVIEATQRTKNALQIDLLKDIDSFGDSREGVISQRSLVNGVAALENSYVSLDKGCEIISDDLGWQSALATAAVGATDEVRDAVIASRTASRAKSAAFTAAAKSKKAYESLTSSSSQDEINAAQSEEAASRSHAIHATVVEYESNVAKKRAAVSLAQDVKCWNTYRKRELLQSCLVYAKSQRDACRNAADAWESLRDGLIDSSTLRFTAEELLNIIPEQTPVGDEEEIVIPSVSNLRDKLTYVTDEVVTNTSLFGSHKEQSLDSDFFSDGLVKKGDVESAFDSVHASSSAASLPEAFVDVTELALSAFELDDSADNVYFFHPPDLFVVDNDHFAPQHDILSEAESSTQSVDKAMDSCVCTQDDFGIESVLEKMPSEDQYNTSVSGENMTMSMQSLIDGLMAWGGDEEPINDIGYQEDIIENGDTTSS